MGAARGVVTTWPVSDGSCMYPGRENMCMDLFGRQRDDVGGLGWGKIRDGYLDRVCGLRKVRKGSVFIYRGFICGSRRILRWIFASA